MLCPHCHTENPSAFGYCSACGKPLSTVDSAPPPPFGSIAGTGVAPALASRQPKRMGVLAMLGMLAVVAFIVFLGFALPAEGANEPARVGFRMGRTFAALVLPAALA